MDALPAPKPTRKRRLPLRLAAFALAASVLFAAYWFTRPPELVWWRSPAVDTEGHRLKALIPSGWEVLSSFANLAEGTDTLLATYTLSPVDKRPKIIRLMFPRKEEIARARINIYRQREEGDFRKTVGSQIVRLKDEGEERIAKRYISRRGTNLYGEIMYTRNDPPAFNRTYRQICNSLTIE